MSTHSYSRHIFSSELELNHDGRTGDDGAGGRGGARAAGVGGGAVRAGGGAARGGAAGAERLGPEAEQPGAELGMEKPGPEAEQPGAVGAELSGAGERRWRWHRYPVSGVRWS
jgi:hypothetical protein